MIKKIYIIYDLIALQTATNFIIQDSDEVMLRNLRDSELPEVMQKHIEDFDIYKIGEFNTETLDFVFDKKLVCHLGSVKNG